MYREVLAVVCVLLQACGTAIARSAPVETPDALFVLPIVHYNDFHARFEQTSWDAGACQEDHEEDCVGGFARLYTAVMKEMQRPDAILLNAGDNFQGTLWYSLYKWRVTVEFMNKLPHDAMGLGNHEFDDKIAGVLDYLDKLNCPVLAANIDDSLEPSFQNKVKESIVIQRGGRSIGIIGYMLSTTNEISSTEKLKFTDEIEAVSRIASQMKKDGVNIIIGLSHSGIEVDKRVAEQVEDIDVIVGGHSHTLLYTGTPPGNDTAYGDYPLVVTQASGRQVLVLQASAYTKYLGNLTLNIDEDGEVVSWEGSPILLDQSVEQDPQILSELAPWAANVSEMGKKELGTTKVFLNSQNCRKGECNIGNFLTDAMINEYVNQSTNGSWTRASIAATNSGGIRTSIDEVASEGVITYNDLVLVQPFENTIDLIELQGKHLLEVLEMQVSKPNQKTDRDAGFSAVNFLQWSGIHVTYDLALPVSHRTLEVTVLCNECRVPVYEPLDPEKVYSIVMNSFLADGGDGYKAIITENIISREIGRKDMDVLVDYIRKMSPLTQGLEGRIRLTTSDTNAGYVFTLPSSLLMATVILRNL